MYNLKRIMVGLDLSEMDEHLIKYTSFISSIIEPEKIYFVHLEKHLTNEAFEEYKGLNIHHPIDESMEEYINNSQKKNFTYEGDVKIEIEVLEGSAYKELIHWSKIKEIDLIITGLKIEHNSSSTIPERLARGAHCSVLMVPLTARFEIKKILIPTDFSEYTRMAFEEARLISKKIPDIKILSVNICKVPLGYYKTGKTFDEFGEIMVGHARKDYAKFIESIDISGMDIEEYFEIDKHNSTSTSIFETATNENVDLIITGVKGQTAASLILLGSVTEKLIRKPLKMPVLVLKHKGEFMSFLDALSEL